MILFVRGFPESYTFLFTFTQRYVGEVFSNKLDRTEFYVNFSLSFKNLKIKYRIRMNLQAKYKI